MAWMRNRTRTALAALLCLAGAFGAAGAAADAGALRESYASVKDKLRNSGFGQPLHIDSAEQQERLAGVVYAALDHPFGVVSSSLKDPARWCDILILPFNTKYCHAVDRPDGPALLVRIGRRFDQPLERAFRLEFDFRNVAARGDYFETRLRAAEGPVGTHDYRIAVSAMPLEGGRTFLRLDYSYGVGAAGRLAMGMYLNTVGADKVGFTVEGRQPNGEPRLIGGVRGAVERNAMRYYLAIDAFLDSLAAPPAQQVERRIRNWFAAAARDGRVHLREHEASRGRAAADAGGMKKAGAVPALGDGWRVEPAMTTVSGPRTRRRFAAQPFRPAALRRAAARSVRSHENSGSSRPKWPYAAVFW